MDNEMLKVIREELCKIGNDVRTTLGVVIAIGVVSVCIWILNMYLPLQDNTKVIPNAGYQMYVTIDDGTTKYEGEATIIAESEEIIVIQMEGQIYIAPTSKVVYE